MTCPLFFIRGQATLTAVGMPSADDSLAGFFSLAVGRVFFHARASIVLLAFPMEFSY